MKTWENAELVELNIKSTFNTPSEEMKMDYIYEGDDGKLHGKQGYNLDESGNKTYVEYYPTN